MRARVLCRRRAPRHGLSLRPPRRSTRRDVRAGEVSGRPTMSSVTSLRAPGSGTSRASCSPLYNDIARQLLPLELGFGSGQTCWRRLDRWQEEGVFDRLHQVLLAELNAVGELDWSRACVDGSHIRAKKGRRHWSVAGRPAEDGQQAPPDLRRKRHPARSHHHHSERQRHHPDRQSDRRHPARRWPARPTATAPRVHPGQKAYDSKAVRRKRRRRRILPFISLKGPRASRAWASSATSSSRLSPCSTSANVSLSNGNDASNSTTPWSHWAAASSAGDASRRLNRELMLQLWELRLTIELAYDARSWTQTCRRRLLSMSKRGRVCR